MTQSPETLAPAATDTSAAVKVRPLHVGIAGATGNVGAMMVRVLEERGIPIASLRAFASERSVGKTITCSGHTATVEDLATADPSGLDVALFSAGGARALAHAPRFAEAGVIVIDNSSAFRMRDDVPLVVPEVNPAAALAHNGIISNPNCSTAQLVLALKPIADAVGLERMTITTFQAVSGTGKAAIDELRLQTAEISAGSAPSIETYPHQIAFNIIPQCDAFDDSGSTKEELKLANESRRILELPDLRVSATCVRVPVYNAHSEAVHFETREELTPDACRELLRSAPGIEVVDSPGDGMYPMPIDAHDRDEVLVGRIRRDPSAPNGLAMFVVADNLRKGAATNAVQILELLAANGAWQ